MLLRRRRCAVLCNNSKVISKINGDPSTRYDHLTGHMVTSTLSIVPTPPRISASDFKARCLGLLDEVHESGAEIVITKRGQPIARLVPLAGAKPSSRGAWRGLARINGDIVHVDWSDDFEANR